MYTYRYDVCLGEIEEIMSSPVDIFTAGANLDRLTAVAARAVAVGIGEAVMGPAQERANELHEKHSQLVQV